MELWNRKYLDPPPTLTCVAPIKEADIKVLDSILKSSIEFFQHQPHLHSEAALLSRIIYRMKMKFRSSKDFKFIQKLNQALLVYLRFDIENDLHTLQDTIPEAFDPCQIYMPCKNMLDYLLVRLQSLGKIFERILNTCCLSADYQQKCLKLGHFWKVVMIVYGIISRIFVIGKNVLKHICDLYSNLYPFTFKLKNIGVEWLPKDYHLPESLQQWVHIDKLELDSSVIEIPDDTFTSLFNLIGDSDDDLEINDEYVVINDEEEARLQQKTRLEGVQEEIISLLTPVKIPRNNQETNQQFIRLCPIETVDIGEDVSKKKKKKKQPKRKTNNEASVIILESPKINQKRKRKPSPNSVIDLCEDTPMKKQKLAADSGISSKYQRRKGKGFRYFNQALMQSNGTVNQSNMPHFGKKKKVHNKNQRNAQGGNENQKRKKNRKKNKQNVNQI